MTRLRRRASIRASLLLLAGLGAAVTAQPAFAQAARPAAAPPVVQGTDVSNQTTVASWASVKAAGVTFTGVLAIDGVSGNNPEYKAEVTGALAAGLFVMPYVFADPLKIGGADQFTKKAWPVIKGIAASPYQAGGRYLPIALDLEAQSVTPKECYGRSQPQMISWINAFIAAARAQAHVTPVIYTSLKWWQDCTGGSKAYGGAPLWIANYNPGPPQIPAGWTGYTFWQKSSSATLSGISGPADLDQLEGAVSAKAATSGSFQLRTLSSLAGDPGPVSYSAAKLPKGVSLTPSGKLGWSKSTPVGALNVIVAAKNAVPATVSETLLVHGPIAIATANRSSTVGRKVGLKITASSPDQKHGYATSLSASGLPPGLGMTAGAVTGKPKEAGSWKVTVTASDKLDGTGSATFIWTIKKG